ncbi:MAG: TolC family protein [Nitrososphaerales archaeon]
MLKILIVLFIILLPLRYLFGLDLVEAVRLAKEFDPAYLSSYHEYRATQNYPYQAISKLLPQAGFSYKETSYNFLTGPKYYVDYSARETQIVLQQVLFNYPLFSEVKENFLRRKLGEIRLKHAEQDLLRRVSEAYFELLYAKEAYEIVKQEKRAIEEHLRMVERLFLAGEATLTDLNDAKARLANSEFRLVDAERLVEIRRKNLSRLIGIDNFSPHNLRSETDLKPILSDDLESWVSKTRSFNLVVQSYEIQKQLADIEFLKQRGQRLPTVNLVAQQQRTEETTYFKIEPLTVKAVGIHLSLPIFSGGYITFKEMELKERFRQAEKDFERVLSDNTQATSESFLAARSFLSAIDAGRVALESARVALDSTKKGFQAGIRTFVDVLNAESYFHRTRLDLLRVTVDFIKSIVALNFYSGTLTDDVIIVLNSTLEKR